MSAADWEPEVDDIKAMRQEGGGDLRAFMRSQIAAGKSRRDDAPKPASAPKPPGHKPGAWPTGSSPPGPPPDWQIPAPVWRAATRHYSNEINRPDEPCDCGNCQPKETR